MEKDNFCPGTHGSIDLDKTHVISFKLTDEPAQKQKEQLEAFRKAMTDSCMWLFPDGTYKNGYCLKCNCSLKKCKSYKKQNP